MLETEYREVDRVFEELSRSETTDRLPFLCRERTHTHPAWVRAEDTLSYRIAVREKNAHKKTDAHLVWEHSGQGRNTHK